MPAWIIQFANVARGSVYTDTPQDRLLTIQRQGILVLRYRDMGQQARRCHALGNRLLWQCGCFDALATRASVLLADVTDHLDPGRYDIQLFRGHRADLGQGGTVVGTDEFLFTQLMNDIHTRQALRQFLAPAFLAGVCRYDDLVIFPRYLGVSLGFIEQTVLIRGYLLAAGGIAPGQCQVQLFLEGENLGLKVFVLDSSCSLRASSCCLMSCSLLEFYGLVSQQ